MTAREGERKTGSEREAYSPFDFHLSFDHRRRCRRRSSLSSLPFPLFPSLSTFLLQQRHQPSGPRTVDAVPHVKVLPRAVGVRLALYPLGAGLGKEWRVEVEEVESEEEVEVEVGGRRSSEMELSFLLLSILPSVQKSALKPRMNPLFLCSLRIAIVFFEIFSASVAEKQNDARKADERESSKKDCRRPRLNRQTEVHRLRPFRGRPPSLATLLSSPNTTPPPAHLVGHDVSGAERLAGLLEAGLGAGVGVVAHCSFD